MKKSNPKNEPRRSKAKVLLLDIETSFKIAGVWGTYDQNVSADQLFQDTHVLCWAAKWQGEKKIMTDALFLHPKAYKADPTNDKPVLEKIWKLLDEADYVIGQNCHRFDLPVLNARFIQHGMKPPSPYIVIDTLLIARRRFKFTSNRLDDLGKALNVGRKKETGGFSLWRDIVLKHDLKAFRKMVAYNKQDVVLLEKVYTALRPWDTQHPNVNPDMEKLLCNVCGSKHLQHRGVRRTAHQTYQRYQCIDCGHWLRAAKAIPGNKSKLRST